MTTDSRPIQYSNNEWGSHLIVKGSRRSRCELTAGGRSGSCPPANSSPEQRYVRAAAGRRSAGEPELWPLVHNKHVRSKKETVRSFKTQTFLFIFHVLSGCSQRFTGSTTETCHSLSHYSHSSSSCFPVYFPSSCQLDSFSDNHLISLPHFENTCWWLTLLIIPLLSPNIPPPSSFPAGMFLNIPAWPALLSWLRVIQTSFYTVCNFHVYLLCRK